MDKQYVVIGNGKFNEPDAVHRTIESKAFQYPVECQHNGMFYRFRCMLLNVTLPDITVMIPSSAITIEPAIINASRC